MTQEGLTQSGDFVPQSERPIRHPLVAAAITDALSRLPENHLKEAERVVRGIENRLAPAIMESEIIARQINSPEYRQEVAEMEDFFECAIVGDTICPDGRQDPIYTIGSPKTVVLHQRPAAKPETRPSSTKRGAMTLNDPNITASLWNAVKRTKARIGTAQLIQFGGVHINSEDPINGCGAMKAAISEKQNPADGMRFGGIARYYGDLGDGFFAFDTVAETVLEIPSRTFDLTHDIHSQGLITGLREAYVQIDTAKTLRENLTQMHQRGQIVMTEFLDPLFRERIRELYRDLFPEGTPINPIDYNQFAGNLIKIGKIARSLTREEEDRGFNFIPDHIIQDATPIARRVLAYTLIQNVAFRTLANIQPGNHPLLKHNERWMRVGSSGPLNIDNVSFALRTPHGSLDDEDMGAVFTLEDILKSALKHSGANLDEEATVIVVCDTFEPEKYATPEIAGQEREFTYSRVGNEAARIRNERKEDIANGRRVVLAALIGKDRTITEVVK